MGKRHPNHRLVKIHRSYTVEEIANLFGIHKNTVRTWIKAGLPTSDDKRPMLILGHELVAALQARRGKNKQTCQPGEIYCVRCRAPKFPGAAMAEYQPVTETFGNLTAICPDCNSIMNRRVSLARIEQVCGKMDITFPLALRHITYREADLMQQWSLLIEECEKLSVPEPLFLAADKLALYQLPTSRRM